MTDILQSLTSKFLTLISENTSSWSCRARIFESQLDVSQDYVLLISFQFSIISALFDILAALSISRVFFIRAKIIKLHLHRFSLNNYQNQLCKLPLCVYNFQIDLKMNQAVNQIVFVVVQEWKHHCKKTFFCYSEMGTLVSARRQCFSNNSYITELGFLESEF